MMGQALPPIVFLGIIRQKKATNPLTKNYVWREKEKQDGKPDKPRSPGIEFVQPMQKLSAFEFNERFRNSHKLDEKQTLMHTAFEFNKKLRNSRMLGEKQKLMPTTFTLHKRLPNSRKLGDKQMHNLIR
ncbi:hypothetical protein RF55_24837 [Lasius niger]|uniref:Uncharacterized protein n=1 Tax=Lasius niger TaxID=67767 RepID=A0A0J7MMR6_LASNI|nr:hypothetical protein RF55_24837 [Lasius niger]